MKKKNKISNCKINISLDKKKTTNEFFLIKVKQKLQPKQYSPICKFTISRCNLKKI
jgi:hypothetical protein